MANKMDNDFEKKIEQLEKRMKEEISKSKIYEAGAGEGFEHLCADCGSENFDFVDTGSEAISTYGCRSCGSKSLKIIRSKGAKK